MIEPPVLPSRAPSRLLLGAIAAFCALFAAFQPPAAAGADRASYILFAEGGQNTTMSGSTEDLRRAKGLRVGREALLYVRQGGSAYVVRDAETLRRARSIFEPQEALGARQAELGSRQAALGGRQAAMGAEQARLGSQQAGASPARATELGLRQEALARRQEELGRQQNALGDQQSVLGRQQERLAREADGKFRALLADALRRGVARRVD
jgi:hypothetical protein